MKFSPGGYVGDLVLHVESAESAMAVLHDKHGKGGLSRLAVSADTQTVQTESAKIDP
jgi:hypothetical protein